MTENKKVFLSVLGMVMAGCVSAANAQQSAQENILFKIHDVQPVKNADGAVVACDFDTTLYNRSNSALRAAVLNLTWTDETEAAGGLYCGMLDIRPGLHFIAAFPEC